MTDLKEFKLNDRFHDIKKEIKGLVSPDMFDDAMRSKADETKFIDLEKLVESIDKLTKQNQTKVSENYDRFYKIQKELKEETYEKNTELRELVYKLDTKIVELEERLDEESISHSESGSDGTHTQDNSLQSVKQSINAGESIGDQGEGSKMNSLVSGLEEN